MTKSKIPRSSERLRTLRERVATSASDALSSTISTSRRNNTTIPTNISTINNSNPIIDDINEATNNNASSNENANATNRPNDNANVIDSSSSTQSSPFNQLQRPHQPNNNSRNEESSDNNSHNNNDDDHESSQSQRSGVYLNQDEYRQLQDTIEALQNQIENYSDRWTNALDRIDALQERNDRLHEQLIQARNSAPAPAPDHSALLQATAKQAEAKARQQNVTHKFPSLKSLNQREVSIWHQKVLTVIQLPKYETFYDNLTSDIVASGHHNPTLNTTLYSEILTHTSAEAESYILAKFHLRGDGVALLNDLQETFNSKWTIVESQQKQLEWISMKMTQSESIHEFFARCFKFREDMIDNGLQCSEDSLRRTFILALSPHFTNIQENIDELHLTWRAPNVHKLPLVAQSYYNNKMTVRNMHRDHKRVNNPTPRNNNQNNQNTNQQNNNQRQQDPIAEARKDAIYASIMAGNFDIRNFVSQVPQNSCVYHANDHTGGSQNCSALRRIFAKAEKRGVSNTPLDVQLSRLNTSSTTSVSSQRNTPPTQQQQTSTKPPARPATANQVAAPQTPAQSLEEINIDDLHNTVEMLVNANDAFSQITGDNLTNHQLPTYFCKLNVVTTNNVKSGNTDDTYRILIDSGASHNLFNTKDLFTTYTEWNDSTNHVTLADGKTTAKIFGSGTISATTINGNNFTIDECLYVPELSNSLLSTKYFSKKPGHYIHTENSKTTIAFPSFTVQSNDTPLDDLIYFLATKQKSTDPNSK